MAAAVSSIDRRDTSRTGQPCDENSFRAVVNSSLILSKLA